MGSSAYCFLIAGVLWALAGCSTSVSLATEVDAGVDGDGDADVDGDVDTDADADSDEDRCDEPIHHGDCSTVESFPVRVEGTCEEGQVEANWEVTRTCDGEQVTVRDRCDFSCSGRCRLSAPGFSVVTTDDGVEFEDLQLWVCEPGEGEDECEPGECRICLEPSFDLWGNQECGDSGRWGFCEETEAPAGLPDGWYSVEDELFCIRMGYCCQDFWDLDRDEDTWESLGNCTDGGCTGTGPDGCTPGSCRWCEPDDAVLLVFGVQYCAEDGSDWGRCVEHPEIPEVCAHVDIWYSPEMQECLTENGHCGRDFWDLDEDGDHWESVGSCAPGECAIVPSVEEECDPGTCRYCDVLATDVWGTQTCEGDGRTWSPCVEEGTIPEECFSDGGWYSVDEELCCILNGFCCRDLWDLDHDGDHQDSLGDCGPRGGCLSTDWTPVCEPGTCRYCGMMDDGRPGSQHCRSDGLGWTACRETALLPTDCVEETPGEPPFYSGSFERCCIEQGYCCQDRWDLDEDGDTRESRGSCEVDGCIIEP